MPFFFACACKYNVYCKIIHNEHLDGKFLGRALLLSYSTDLWSTKLKLILIEIIWKNDKKLFKNYTITLTTNRGFFAQVLEFLFVC